MHLNKEEEKKIKNTCVIMNIMQAFMKNVYTNSPLAKKNHTKNWKIVNINIGGSMHIMESVIINIMKIFKNKVDFTKILKLKLDILFTRPNLWD